MTPSPPQRRLLLAVETMGRMPVDGPDASRFSISTRRACRCAGWVRQTGTLGAVAWELTEAGAFVLARTRMEELAATTETANA